MMNQTDIFKKIGSILQEITDQYHYLATNLENLNALELELFSANASFLADHIEILRRLNAAKQHTEQPLDKIPSVNEDKKDVPEKPVEPVQPEPPTQAEKQEEEQPEITNTSEEEEQSSAGQQPVHFILDAEPIEDEPESEPEEQLTEEPVKAEPETVPQTEPEPSIPQKPAEAESAVVNEVVIQEKTVSIDVPEPVEEQQEPVQQSPVKTPTLNELISAQKGDSTLAGQFVKQPVTDLKSIISLNDKIVFVKDLFNGYSLAYSEAMELVNRFDTFEAADNFLQTNYAVKNNWSEKQATVDKLYELLNRRFSR